MPGFSGYEIVCPDGHVRRYPYTNDATAVSDARHVTENGCWRMGSTFAEPNEIETRLPSCPGGEHTVRGPVPVEHPYFSSFQSVA